jgi:putative hydrolase of the HAD superfamily
MEDSMTEISPSMLQDKDPMKLDISEISAWVFDLDNTIYPAHQSLFPRVASRMIDWIEQNFKLEREQAEALKTRLFLEYGTTMNGLSSEYSVEPEDFLSYVHDIDLSDLSYDKELDAGMSALPGKKYIYTNGTVLHASRILEAYGIGHHFEFIFDIFASNHLPKPALQPYQDFLAQSEINPKQAVMIEDMARNLEPAAKLGMQTVWLMAEHSWAKKGATEPYVHYIARDLKHFLSDAQHVLTR